MYNLSHTYTKEELVGQLEQLHAPTNSVVLMHSSLRAIGPVAGGAEALLDALIEYFTKDGGLFCVPTHTWHNLGKAVTLDMNSDESCLGAFASIAIRDPRGVRSENPTHSMMVFGDKEKALAFVQDELRVSSPTSPSSCYGKIFDRGGYVLLVGVAHNRNTCLHTVDEMLGISNRMDNQPVPVAVCRKDGHRCITDGFIGNAPAQLCDARKMKRTIALIYQNSGGVDPLADEAPIPPKWYCLND